MNPRPEKVLITGGRGLLGTPLAERFRSRGTEVFAPGRAELDITNSSAVTACLDRFRPGLVVNCAAYTRVDDCEQNEAMAQQINAGAAGELAGQCAARAIRFIHLSTDYVFAGPAAQPIRETDPPGPAHQLCAYGRTKLLGEQLVQAACPQALIIRTAWLYGEDGPCFPKTILRLARERPSLRVVNDQTGSPTYARDLAEAIVALAATNAAGLVHVANSGTCTWHEFASAIVRAAGLDTDVVAIGSDELRRPAKRPAYSVMDNARFNEWTGRTMRPWSDALQEFLARYGPTGNA